MTRTCTAYYSLAAVLVLLMTALSARPASAAELSDVPQAALDIGFEPQFFFDQHVVDHKWALRPADQAVLRVFHQPKKHEGNPILRAEEPNNVWVIRDADTGLFRMYYQICHRINPDVVPEKVDRANEPKGPYFRTSVAYAESKDGIRWTRPDLDLYPRPGYEPNNIVLGNRLVKDFRADMPSILEGIPEKDRRGLRYLMLYDASGTGGSGFNGIRLIGSQDGIHWDEASDTRLVPLHPEVHNNNTIVYDPRRGEYVMFCRGGPSRYMLRLSSRTLWTDWLAGGEPQGILSPDELDAAKSFNCFHGMSARYYAGLYWACLEPMRWNDYIATELAWSRDGVHFERLPTRPRLLEYGPGKSWDNSILKVSPSWVEVGNEWYFYYAAWDGPHNTSLRHGGIGLATLRKEGLISLRGPTGGGMVRTRAMRWPGGSLVVNADAAQGELSVRVSDARGQQMTGYDYQDCDVFRGDEVAHKVTWQGRSLDALQGRELRLEFSLKDADLYTFRAAPADPLPRVLLIGDSISRGYHGDVVELLAGKANVHRPPVNCRSTALGLKEIDNWLGEGKWDVIHFNWGLHDLKYVDDSGQNAPPDKGHQQVPLEQYEKNLRQLVQRMKKTGARLIWAATTPVPEGEAQRVHDDARRYNAAAAKVMAEQGIETNDLHAFASERLGPPLRRQPNDVHFTREGSRLLAERVAQAISKSLGTVERSR